MGMGRCCCDTGCAITADTFDRANNANINTGAPFTWDVRNGAASISGNLLEISTTDTLLICGTGHPNNLASAVVTADVYFGGNDPARIIVGHDGSDDDNFHFVEIKPYELALHEMVSGTPSLLACVGCDATANPSTITVYFDGETTGRFTATCGSAFVETDGISATGKKYVGLGLGTVDGGIAFDNFTFAKHKQDGNTCSEFAPPACVIGSDDFNRTDDTDPGCGWDELTGTSAISGNKLVFTAAGRALFVPSVSDGSTSVTVTFSGTDENNTIEIGVGATSDASALWYVRLAIGPNKPLVIGSLAAGTIKTQAGVYTTVNLTYTMSVTLTDGKLCASLIDDNDEFISVVANVTVPTGARHATLGCSSRAGGSVAFENFIVGEGCTPCGVTGPTCDDDCCPENHTVMNVTIPGGLTDLSTCTRCSGVAGTYVCEDGPCGYSYNECSNGDCPDSCSEGDGTFVICSDGDSPITPGKAIVVSIQIDENNQCYLVGSIYLTSGYKTWAGGTMLAIAQYFSATGEEIRPCSGTAYTLYLYNDGDACGSGLPRNYNGGFVYDGRSPGCGGSLPATITVQSAP